MNGNKDNISASSSSKALLYSEILGISVKSHVHELLHKKNKKICTYPVQRSPVLVRVSKLLKSMEKDKDAENIEIVEEGKPVIDMSVTLIDKKDGSECDSEVDTENEDSDIETGDKKLVKTDSESDSEESEDENEKTSPENENEDTLSNSESEQSENEDMLSDSDSELSENENEDMLSDLDSELAENENEDMLSDSDSELAENESGNGILRTLLTLPNLDYEQCKNVSGKCILEDKNLSASSDLDEKQIESEITALNVAEIISVNKDNRQFENKELLNDIKHGNILKSNNKSLKQECDTKGSPKNNLELSKSDFGLIIDDLSYPTDKYEKCKLELSGNKKRKLVSVIEEDNTQNIPSKKHGFQENKEQFDACRT